MAELNTSLLDADPSGLRAAADVWRAGGLVAFPTETVYGLGADATNADAVARIYEAKGRPSFNPLIVHLPDLDSARAHVEIEPAAQMLAERFWPGPLTLVLPLRRASQISPLVTAGLSTLAVRVPQHRVALDLLRQVGRPIAAPSANLSGSVSPTSAAHVRAGLGGRIDAVVEGGPSDVGVESTIVQVVDGVARVLRPGGRSGEDISGVIQIDATAPPVSATPTAPGQLTSHYAPIGRVRMNAMIPLAGEVHIGFGAVAGDVSLSVSGDPREAAARLFDLLHQMDAEGVTKIAVAPIPQAGLGAAINDRLRRASAPR